MYLILGQEIHFLFASFLIVSLTPFINKPDSSRVFNLFHGIFNFFFQDYQRSRP